MASQDGITFYAATNFLYEVEKDKKKEQIEDTIWEERKRS